MPAAAAPTTGIARACTSPAARDPVRYCGRTSARPRRPCGARGGHGPGRHAAVERHRPAGIASIRGVPTIGSATPAARAQRAPDRSAGAGTGRSRRRPRCAAATGASPPGSVDISATDPGTSSGSQPDQRGGAPLLVEVAVGVRRGQREAGPAHDGQERRRPPRSAPTTAVRLVDPEPLAGRGVDGPQLAMHLPHPGGALGDLGARCSRRWRRRSSRCAPAGRADRRGTPSSARPRRPRAGAAPAGTSDRTPAIHMAAGRAPASSPSRAEQPGIRLGGRLPKLAGHEPLNPEAPHVPGSLVVERLDVLRELSAPR